MMRLTSLVDEIDRRTGRPADHAANVGLSLAIVIALLPLALFGVLGLAAVVLVHELAEVVVIADGVRAGRAKPLAIDAVDRPATRPPMVAGAPIASST